MSIDSIQRVAQESLKTELKETTAVDNTFIDMLNNGLKKINNTLNSSDKAIQQLATGDSLQLHQVMIGIEKAKMEFELVKQIRNRLLNAYQSIMKEQL